MKIYNKSDIGLVRDTNQDACYYKILSDTCSWALVCDGMGGVNGGGTASKIAVESIKESMKNLETTNMDELLIKDFLINSALVANEAILKESRQMADLNGMGTTLILAVLFDELLHIVHVGDSRAYIINTEQIHQITIDHSIVQEMLSSGEITEDQARNHPQKNIITRALGLQEEVNVDYIKVFLQECDNILICTDGLTNHVTEEEILKEFRKTSDIQKFTDAIIESAKIEGGSDNITVMMIDNEK